MTDSEKLQRIQAILNVDNVGDVCHCENCEAHVPHNFTCTLCGYNGKAVTIACQCYDYSCAGSGSNGAGCPHGVPTCPFCDCGEGDSYVDFAKAIREIRKVLLDH